MSYLHEEDPNDKLKEVGCATGIVMIIFGFIMSAILTSRACI